MDHDKWTSEHREIRRIILLSDDDAIAELTRLKSAEQVAYGRYTGATSAPRPEPGTPRAIGHGSWVSDLNAGGVQDRWNAARAARVRFERVRSGRWDVERRAETTRYSLNLDGHVHQIEVDHHGISLDDCPNPAAAIAKVRCRSVALA